MSDHYTMLFLWGFIATCAMACIQEGTQAFGFSRMSFPFIIGTFFTGSRRRAELLGFACYILGGWLFTLFYIFLFHTLGNSSVWLGMGIGLAQGLFMLLVLMPLLSYIHPRMISPYDGPTSVRRIEPPGFMALHYGRRAPIVHIIGQMVFGGILGAVY